jgi:hypothetical protein
LPLGCGVAAVMVDMAGPSWKVKPVALQAKRGKPKEVKGGNLMSVMQDVPQRVRTLPLHYCLAVHTLLTTAHVRQNNVSSYIRHVMSFSSTYTSTRGQLPSLCTAMPDLCLHLIQHLRVRATHVQQEACQPQEHSMPTQVLGDFQ